MSRGRLAAVRGVARHPAAPQHEWFMFLQQATAMIYVYGGR